MVTHTNQFQKTRYKSIPKTKQNTLISSIYVDVRIISLIEQPMKYDIRRGIRNNTAQHMYGNKKSFTTKYL